MNTAAQLDMFSVPALRRRVQTPIARRHDPDSSHAAAEQITRDGTLAIQQAQTIDAVRRHPGKTSQELAELDGLDRYMLARRLPECVTAGAVHKGEQRRCSVTGRLALTWWPA